ncbi:MAG: hypothetical protein ACXVB9_16715 [Bdellovibrionota bacterium]
MRSFFFLLCMFSLLLPLHAKCAEEFDMGPSVGGGDGSMIEPGSIPEGACAAAGGEMKIDRQTEPHGGDNALNGAINSNQGDKYQSCDAVSNL